MNTRTASGPWSRGHEAVLDLLIAALWGGEDIQRTKLAALSDRDLGRLDNLLRTTVDLTETERRARGRR